MKNEIFSGFSILNHVNIKVPVHSWFEVLPQLLWNVKLTRWVVQRRGLTYLGGFSWERIFEQVYIYYRKVSKSNTSIILSGIWKLSDDVWQSFQGTWVNVKNFNVVSNVVWWCKYPTPPAEELPVFPFPYQQVLTGVFGHFFCKRANSPKFENLRDYKVKHSWEFELNGGKEDPAPEKRKLMDG